MVTVYSPSIYSSIIAVKSPSELSELFCTTLIAVLYDNSYLDHQCTFPSYLLYNKPQLPN